MDIDIVTQQLNPCWIIAMYGSRQLIVSSLPFILIFKLNIWHRVVNDRERTHPEMIDQPRHYKKAHKSEEACGNNQSRKNDRRISDDQAVGKLDL